MDQLRIIPYTVIASELDDSGSVLLWESTMEVFYVGSVDNA